MITKIKITIGGHEHELTLEDAQALYNELGRLFPSPVHITWPAPQPPWYPVTIPQPTYPAQPWEVTYQGPTCATKAHGACTINLSHRAQ